MCLACCLSALVPAVGSVPTVAEASPVFVLAKASTIPLIAKVSPAPVTGNASSIPVAATPSPEPVAAKAAPAPVNRKASPATPVVAKASPETFVAKGSPAPVSRKAPFVPSAIKLSGSSYLVPEGESRVYHLAGPVKRVAIANPEVADYILINPSEIYLLGKKPGATNLTVWDRYGNVKSAPLFVSRNVKPIEVLLKMSLPYENDIQIYSVGPALVLSGSVSDAMTAETAYRLVKAYLGGTVPEENPENTLVGSESEPFSGIISQSNKVSLGSGFTGAEANGGNGTAGAAQAESMRGVVNLLKVRNSQQVRLEVCIAQVSRTFLETLGVSFLKNTGDIQGGTLLTGLVSSATLNNVFRLLGDGKNAQVTADRKPSLFKVLAEPTMVTVSGKEGQFLVGGKIYVPIGISELTGQVRYESQLYGVGLRFMPTVLDTGRMSLKVVAEVSEPEKEPVNAGTKESWPAFKLSTVSTSVQMNEGENLVIGGLKLDNLTNEIDSVPLLGEIPILGALFRDAKKTGEKTELMVIVRPTLVNASTTMPELPTDKVAPPTRGEFFFGGKLEGSRK
ncbi:MAG: pilus assembly protein N-terminal domain-containing protein [Chlorobiaceae bacterium]|nr:pilus assembly protein N-terminal domain-containing protein [Chlorobiaceae bacterium]